VPNGDQVKHWSEFVSETVLLVLHDAGGLHFDIVGGADEGKFPYIGPLKCSPEEAGVTVQSLSPSGMWPVYTKHQNSVGRH
jgi:hypothetical protein